jgi:hypothetical protein
MLVHGSSYIAVEHASCQWVLGSVFLGSFGTRLADPGREIEPMRLALLLAGLFVATMPITGTESLKMSVSPAQSLAPAYLRVRLTVEPNAVNRTIAVVTESDDYFRSSELPLEGEQGPRTIFFEFRGVPSGEYQIRGLVGDAKGHEVASVQQNVNVIASGMER